MRRVLSAIAFACLSTSPVWAVYGTNTGPGSSDSTFIWVGQANGASGVVVAPHWVITAQHVGGTNFVLNGVTYTADKFIDNPNYDLHLMHFSNTFADYYRLYSGNPIGQTVHLVGYGDTGLLRPDGLGYNDVGFGSVRRAATNVIGDRQIVPYNGWNTPELLCDLDPPLGNTFPPPYNRDWFGDGTALPNEGGLMGGDSGGAWLILVNGQYQLAGISNYIFYDDSVSGNDPNPYFAFGISGSAGADLTDFNVRRWVWSVIRPKPISATVR